MDLEDTSNRSIDQTANIPNNISYNGDQSNNQQDINIPNNPENNHANNPENDPKNNHENNPMNNNEKDPVNNPENNPNNRPENYTNNNSGNNNTSNTHFPKNTMAGTYHPTQSPFLFDNSYNDLVSEPEEPNAEQQESSLENTQNTQQNTNSKKSSHLSTKDIKKDAKKKEFIQLIKDNECATCRFKFKNYRDCGIESGFILYKKNLAQYTSLNHFLPRTKSEGPKQLKNIITQLKNDPKQQNNNNNNINLNDKIKLDNLKKLLLSHLYQVKITPKSFTEDVFSLLISQLSCYMKNSNITLANFIGFSLTNNEKTFFPTFLTQRPVNGSLSHLFETIHKNQSTQPSEGTNNEKITIKPTNFYNIDDIRAINPDQKFAIICGITDGLAYIHNNQLIHSNLNPTTIYLDEYLHPKICDYIFIPSYKVTAIGNKKNPTFKYFFDKKPEPNSFQNPLYIAPEIFNENKEFDQKIDIYSLGLLMFYILTEKEPTPENLSTHLDNFGNKWKKWIKKCISDDPTTRPTAKKLLEKLLNKKNMKVLLSTISSNTPDPEISFRNDLYFRLLQKSVDKEFDFNDKEFDILQSMIQNPNDIDENTMMIIQSAESGDVKSIKKVGDFFFYGQNNILRDDNYAYRCYKEAADKEDIDSMILVAKFEEDGIIDYINYGAALDSYQDAYDKMDDDDPRKSEVQLKLDELPKKIQESKTITLLDVPLSIDPKICRDFKKYKFKVEKIPPNKGEKLQQVKIIFNDKTNFNNLIIQKTRDKQDYFEICKKQFKFSYISNKPNILNRLKSLDLYLKPINILDYYPGQGRTSFLSIGSGSFGNIYKVYRRQDDKAFAAKILNTDDLSEDDKINFFKREIIAAARFNHPAIVHYEGFSEFNLKEMQTKINLKKLSPTLLMNFIPRDNLEKIIKKNPNAWNDTAKLKVIVGIISALVELCKQNIVHRDLKPENIVLNENYEPVLCDFGSARECSDDKKLIMSRNVGTLPYMAPEIYSNANPNYGYEVDIYSFGVTLYQILSNNTYDKIYPKKSNIRKEKFNNYVGEIPEEMKVHPFLINLMKSCWNSRYNERPDPVSIYHELVKEINKDVLLLPNADLDKVKEYIDILPEV